MIGWSPMAPAAGARPSRVLSNPAVTGAVVGARRPGQMLGFGGAVDFRLSPREQIEIEARSTGQAA